jgi:hypothetical protein
VAIELIAAQGAPMTSSAPLEPVRTSVRERVERLDRDRHLAPDIAAAAELCTPALAAAAEVELSAFDGATEWLVSPSHAIKYCMMPPCPRVSTTPA